MSESRHPENSATDSQSQRDAALTRRRRVLMGGVGVLAVLSLVAVLVLGYVLAGSGSGGDGAGRSPSPSGSQSREPGPASPSPSASPTPAPSPSPSPSPEREPTMAAALTVHPTATEAAMDVLAEGGTAADAAFATAAVLSVIEPYYSNLISGETSALYHDGETGEIRSLEAVGTVGSDFDLDTYRSQGPASFGLHQALVPGSWDGWIQLLQSEGTLGLDRLLEPAIVLARDGHPATAATASQVRSALNSGSMNGPARAIYAPGGNPVSEGQTIVQSDFATTLQGIVDVYTDAGDREAGLVAARDHVYTGEFYRRVPVRTVVVACSRQGTAVLPVWLSVVFI